MAVIYFAYGSNLCFPRLRARVPGVRALGPALLRGHELRWHKRGTDGSGKCSIVKVGGDVIVLDTFQGQRMRASGRRSRH